MSDTNKQNSCSQRPCTSRDYGRLDSDEANAELRGRPILYTGVVWIGIVRRFLIPRRCSALPPEPQPEAQPVARSVSHSAAPATAASTAAEPKLLHLSSKTEEKQDGGEQLLRRRQRDSPLLALVSQIKEAGAGAALQVRQLSDDLSELVQDGKTTTSDTIESLRQEQALLVRCGAVTASGLVGYLAGLRRGAVTRLVYSATGATAMAALCYPEQARHYNSRGLSVVRRVIVVGLDLVRDGPQRILVRENVEVLQESNDKPQHQSGRSKIEKHDETSDLHLEQNLEINKVFSTEARQESKQAPDVSSQNNHTEIPNLMTSSSVEEEKLSSVQRGSGIINSMPYSPALPSPPKMELGDDHSSESYQNTKENSANNVPVTTTPQKVQTSLHAYSLHDSNRHQERDATKLSESVSKQYYDKDKSNFVVGITPTHENTVMEKDLKLGVGENLSKSENQIKNEQQPLNKKLNRYYGQQSDETLATPEKGYDDLYSKRR